MPNDNPQGVPEIDNDTKAKYLAESNSSLRAGEVGSGESFDICLFSRDSANSQEDSLESWFKTQKNVKVTEEPTQGLITVYIPDTNERICEYKKPGIANFAYPKGQDLLKAFFKENTGKEFTVNKCSSVEAAIELATLAKANGVTIKFKPEILVQLEESNEGKNNERIREKLAKILEVADSDLVHKTAHKRPN